MGKRTYTIPGGSPPYSGSENWGDSAAAAPGPPGPPGPAGAPGPPGDDGEPGADGFFSTAAPLTAAVLLVASGAAFPLLSQPSSPDAWNLEARQMVSPDLAVNGWTVRLQNEPWTLLTRAGNVDYTTQPAVNTYRSTLSGGALLIQGNATQGAIAVLKATDGNAYTYKSHAYGTRFGASDANYTWLANSEFYGQTVGYRGYYHGIEGTNVVEVLLAGISTPTFPNPGNFTLYVVSPVAGWQANTVKYINYSGPSSFDAQEQEQVSAVQVLARTARVIVATPTHAGVWLAASSGQLTALDFIRRTPYRAFP